VRDRVPAERLIWPVTSRLPDPQRRALGRRRPPALPLTSVGVPDDVREHVRRLRHNPR